LSKRHTIRPERGPVLLIGLGGIGMMGLPIARALFATPPTVADIDAESQAAC
jgi:alcohol dehydrogenase